MTVGMHSTSTLTRSVGGILLRRLAPNLRHHRRMRDILARLVRHSLVTRVILDLQGATLLSAMIPAEVTRHHLVPLIPGRTHARCRCEKWDVTRKIPGNSSSNNNNRHYYRGS